MKQFLKSRPKFYAGGLSQPMRGERGAVAIIVAASMFALLALILLAVQVGTIGTVRALLQGSADQAAMAGARQIDGTDKGLTSASSEAMNILSGGKNFPDALNEGADLSIAGDAFETGVWDFGTSKFTPEATNADIVNAVRVRGRKTATLNGPIDMFLGGDFGPDTVSLSRTGIAALGAAASLPCRPELPIAVCEELITCGEKLRILMAPSTTDNAAWTAYDEGANANTLRRMIRDCSLIPDAHTGDCITLNNGSVNSAGMELRRKFDAHMAANPCPESGGNVRIPDREFPGCNLCGANVGNETLDINGDGVKNADDCGMPAAIPLIPCSESIGNACNGDSDTLSNFNQTRQIAGFGLVVITDVNTQGSPKYVDIVPLCGISFPDSPTGGPPACSPSSPVACATDPILVNADLRD